jgi:magnesium-transporting ATPase (P-type)
VEDKLQDGVPDTIRDLGRAGIKMWVLTGDKEETAVNIGFSCKLLRPDMKLITLRSESEEELVAQMDGLLQVLSPFEDSRPLLQRVMEDLAQALSLTGGSEGRGESGQGDSLAAKNGTESLLNLDHVPSLPGSINKHLGLIVTGEALAVVLADPLLESRFLRLAQLCSAVIACRSSPSQKSAIVRMVKEREPRCPITLAIGDGANDVGMIQEAQVGEQNSSLFLSHGC